MYKLRYIGRIKPPSGFTDIYSFSNTKKQLMCDETIAKLTIPNIICTKYNDALIQLDYPHDIIFYKSKQYSLLTLSEYIGKLSARTTAGRAIMLPREGIKDLSIHIKSLRKCK